MSNKRIHFMLVLLAVLSVFNFANGQSDYISSSYLTASPQNIIQVPANVVNTIKSLAVYGWVRPSQTMDFSYPSSNTRDKYSVIMGSSTSSSGWGDNVKGVDSFLNLSTGKWKESSGFILGFEDGKTFDYLYANIPYTSYFGRWFYLYGAYHADVKKHYFAVYSAFDNTWTSSWGKEVQKLPILSYYQFSVSASDIKKSTQFNGYVQDSGLTYLPDATYYSTTESLEQFLNGKIAPKYIGLTQKEKFTVVGEAQTIPTDGIYQSFTEYKGADEYAIYGQSQYTSSFSSSANTLLFRLSTNNPDSFGDSYVEGDIALIGYVEKGKKTCFGTYRITTSTTDLKSKSCFSVVPNKNWFYFYQGYSRKLGRVFSYVRINDVNYYEVTKDVLHVDPNAFYLKIGKDSVTNRWASSVRGFTVEFGPGAYTENLLDSLPEVGQKDEPAKVIIPQTYKTPVLIESLQSLTKPLDAQAVDSTYVEIVQEYAIHFWYRRDLLSPEVTDFQDVKVSQSIAGVTEREDFTSTDKPGDQTLSIQYISHTKADQPGYIFSTYSGDSTKDYTFKFDEKFNQGQWHWVYFGYSKTLQQASIAVVLPDGTKITKLIEGVNHNSQTSLKSLLGQSGDKQSVPGQFFDFQFVYYDGCYQNNQSKIDNYVSTFVKSPPSTQPSPGVYTLFLKKFLVRKSRTIKPLNLVQNAAGALSYQITSWAKWNKYVSKSSKGNIVATLSIYSKESIQNRKKLGDVVLNIQMRGKYVQFETYNYEHKKNSDDISLAKKIYVPKAARNSWCFYSLSYSHLDKVVVGSMICKNGFKTQYVFKDVQHIIPSQFTFQSGTDGISSKWRGYIHKPSLIIGYPIVYDYSFDPAFFPENPESIEDPNDTDSNEPKKEEDELDDIDGINDEEDGAIEEEDDGEEEEEEVVDPISPTPEPPVVDPQPTPEPPVVDPQPTPEPPVVDPQPTPEPPVVDPVPTPEPPVVDPEPIVEPQNNCAVVYQECGYINKFQEICENIPSLSLHDIRSIQIPEGKLLKFYDKVNYEGLNVKFLASVECIELGLLVDPQVKWQQLITLFNTGQIRFIDSNGEEISTEDAEAVFFKSNKQQKKKHLKKQQKTIQRDVESFVEFSSIPTKENSKTFWEKIMFW